MTQLAFENARRAVFTRMEAEYWSGEQGVALDGLLKRAVGAGELLRYRRGLYGLAKRFERVSVHPFELAQQMYGPSYISLEGALAHQGWIPEAVYTVTSVSSARSRSFDTPVGLFSFTRIPQNCLFAGVRQETTEQGGIYFIATPIKALADYVYVHRCSWTSLAPARESLRIEEAELEHLDRAGLDELEGVYRDPLVRSFLKGVGEELQS